MQKKANRWTAGFLGPVLLVFPTDALAEPAKLFEQILESLENSVTKDAKKTARIQELLSDSGFYDGVINGKYDLPTETAVKAFQSGHGFAVTGRLTKRQISRLKELANERSQQAGKNEEDEVALNSPPNNNEHDRSELTIADIQHLLFAAGYYKDASHGLLNHSTKTAIAAFQLDHRFPVTDYLTEGQVLILKRRTADPDLAPHSTDTQDMGLQPEQDQQKSHGRAFPGPRSEYGDMYLACVTKQEAAKANIERRAAELKNEGITIDILAHLSSRNENGCAIQYVDEDSVSKLRLEAAERKRAVEKVQAEVDARTAAIAEERTKIDDTDVVAKVLNYSLTGKDEGLDDAFWIKVSQCKYKRGGKDTYLDINSLDPQGISIVSRNESDPFNQQYIGGSVFYDGYPLFGIVVFSNRKDPARLERGWNLIFGSHCKGTRKPF